MRRPAKLERSGALTPRDRIWAAIRAFNSANNEIWFSVAEVMVLSGQRVDTVLSYMRGLEKAGYVEMSLVHAPRPASAPRREFTVFFLSRDVGVEAPRVDADGKPVTQGIGREQLWRAMRILKGHFDWRGLAAAASTEEHPVSDEEAKCYARFLRLAGYLQTVKPARRGMGRAPERLRFVRSRDTGPRAPIIGRDKSVMDGNTGDIVLPGGKS